MYTNEYYYKLLRQNSATAEEINRIRWNFVANVNPSAVLDYGAGVGWFKAFAPEGVEVDTFDIGAYPQTGVTRAEYDLITLWDVIEHIPDHSVLADIFSRTRYVALSVPILPEGKELRTWKHYKPGEHLHYFSVRILDEIMRCFGFVKVKQGEPENIMREDIISFLYAQDNP